MLFILLFVCLVPAAIAQQELTIFGSLTNADAAPVAGLPLELQTADGEVLEITHTGEDGSYSFTTLWTTAAQADSKPATLSLDAPWPNPAVADVQTRVHVSRQGSYSVEVFDVLGRRISVKQYSLVPGAGTLQLGRPGADGVYLIRVSGAGEVATRMFTVVGGKPISGQPAVQWSAYMPAAVPAYSQSGAGINSSGFVLNLPESAFYDGKQREVPHPAEGATSVQVDLTTVDLLSTSVITGTVQNIRQEAVAGVLIANEYGSATSDSSGQYVLELTHEKRKEGQLSTINFSHPNYNSKDVDVSLEDQSLDALLDIILQENNFLLNARTVNFDDETMPFVLKYLNEAGTDSVEVNLTPSNGVINVNFNNWPGEDAVLYNTSSSDMNEEDQRLDIMALRSMDQIPLALNISQSETGEPLYLPLQTPQSVSNLANS
ncbi:T9SS type A sorting domain-containing protein [Cyclonatronum proteinivorum]|nr:T9SS type A sorting domain-containing protein [Cyclonatronum proteinivorum]